MVDAAEQQEVLTQDRFEVELARLRELVRSINDAWRTDHVYTGPLRFTDGGVLSNESDEDRATRQARETEAQLAQLSRKHQTENDRAQARAICDRLSGTRVRLTVKATAHRSRLKGSGIPGVIGAHLESYDIPVDVMFTDVELTLSLGKHPGQFIGAGDTAVVASCMYQDERVTFSPYDEDVIMNLLPH